MRYIERCIVRDLVASLEARGFQLCQVEGQVEAPRKAITTPEALIAYADEWDDNLIVHCRKLKSRSPRRWLLLIPGNGEDIISDFGAGNPEFEAAITEVCNEIST